MAVIDACQRERVALIHHHIINVWRRTRRGLQHHLVACLIRQDENRRSAQDRRNAVVETDFADCGDVVPKKKGLGPTWNALSAHQLASVFLPATAISMEPATVKFISAA